MCKNASAEKKAISESKYGKCVSCKRSGNAKFCPSCEAKSNYLFDWKSYAVAYRLFPYSDVG